MVHSIIHGWVLSQHCNGPCCFAEVWQNLCSHRIYTHTDIGEISSVPSLEMVASCITIYRATLSLSLIKRTCIPGNNLSVSEDGIYLHFI